MELNFVRDNLYLPDYNMEKKLLSNFIMSFEDPSMQRDALHGKHKYQVMMQQVSNRKLSTFNITISDL